MFELSIVIMENTDELEIRDIFLRLQEGVSLNPAEKRNALTGKLRDFIATTAEHQVFQYVRLNPNLMKRFGRDDWLAHVSRLEIANTHVDVKATDLWDMYESHKTFNDSGSVAAKIKRVLNYMSRALEPGMPEMNIKWGFVDLYWLISHLIDAYNLTGRERDFQIFYQTFEERRRAVEDIEDLLHSGDILDKQLFDYIQAFQRSGSTKGNIKVRHEVYRSWFQNLYPDLVPKDPTRDFSEDERIVIWRRAQQRCESCEKPLTFAEMHADHVIPHSKGGFTTLDNAQCLCGTCNKSKGNTT